METKEKNGVSENTPCSEVDFLSVRHIAAITPDGRVLIDRKTQYDHT